MLPTIVVDVETSGRDPRKHAILELGAVFVYDRLDGHGPVVADTFESLIALGWLHAAAEPEAMAINGITTAELQHAPPLETARGFWNGWLKKCADRVVGPMRYASWFASFDAPFLAAADLWTPTDGLFFCVRSAAGAIWGDDIHLNSLAAALHLKRRPIGRNNGAAHSALSDADLAAQIFIEIEAQRRHLTQR